MTLLLLFLGSFVLSFILYPFYIQFLKKYQFGQKVREEGPKAHQIKSGTPTMGGVVFVLVTTVLSLIFLDKTQDLWIFILLFTGFSFVGFLDDFLKIKRKRNLGLTAKQKLIAQIVISVASYVLLVVSGFDTTLTIPATDISFDLVWGYVLFFLFFAIGTTNATNLTDGLDGLLGGLAIISTITYAIIAYLSEHALSVSFSMILLGSLFAYIWFNQNPAKIFMGDTGSLAIGGYLVAVSVLTKTELLLAIIGGVYVFETLTVIIQVLFYKWKKKRIFKMTPIHHSFELSGWSEWQTVFFFWFVGGILSVASVLLVLF